METTLNTEIPDMENDGMSNSKKIAIVVTERQLFYIFLALARLELLPDLENAILSLADEIYKIGEKSWGWPPVMGENYDIK